jgi:hypothetical protein
MSAAGLSPRRIQKGVATGYDRFELYRLETQVAETDIEALRQTCFASVEVKALVEHPTLGTVEIYDRITQQASSLDGALETCANTFMDVTFPAIESLFTGRPFDGRSIVRVTSFTPEIGRAINWEVFLGRLQIVNDPEGHLAATLSKQQPISLMFDALTGQLSEVGVHWAKLYGEHPSGGTPKFGCSIDGSKSSEAEDEMRRKFGEPEIPGRWEFRQFLVARPVGEADEQVTEELRARMSELQQPTAVRPPENQPLQTRAADKPSWFRKLFGRGAGR